MGFAYEVKGIEACIGEGVVEAPRMAEAKASRNTSAGCVWGWGTAGALEPLGRNSRSPAWAGSISPMLVKI